jgi:hypothetical protein
LATIALLHHIVLFQDVAAALFPLLAEGGQGGSIYIDTSFHLKSMVV